MYNRKTTSSNFKNQQKNKSVINAENKFVHMTSCLEVPDSSQNNIIFLTVVRVWSQS